MANASPSEAYFGPGYSPYLVEAVSTVHQALEEYIPEGSAARAPWDGWRPTPPAPGETIPEVVVVGEALLPTGIRNGEAPRALMPIVGGAWHIAMPLEQRFVPMAKNMLVRSLGCYPPGSIKVLMYDLTGDFNDFNSLGRDLIEHIERNGLEAKLADLADLQHHILTGGNAGNGALSKQRYILVINGDTKLSDRAQSDLAYLLDSGTEWGGVLAVGTGLPSYKRVQTTILGNVNCDLEPEVPPRVIRSAAEWMAGETARDRAKPVAVTEIDEGPLWSHSAAYELKTVIGRDLRNGGLITVDLEKIPHIMACGRTRSGKSIFLNSVICSLAKKYGPQELEVMYMDGAGPAAAIFAPGPGDETYLPHARLLAGNMDDPEFSILALTHVEQVIKQRIGMLSSIHGAKYEDLKGAFPDDMRRLVVVCDELQELLSDAEYGNEAVKKLMYIVKNGAKAGVHFIAATQDIGSIQNMWGLEGGIMQQFGLRIHMPGAQGVMDVVDNEDLSAQVTERGYAWINNNGGKGPAGHNAIVRIPDATNPQVQTMKQFMWQYRPADSRPPVTYDGKVRPKLEESTDYGQLAPTGKRVTEALVGQGFTMDGAAAKVSFTNDRGSNLLVVGTKHDEIARVFRSTARSLAKQHEPHTATFTVMCCDSRQAEAAGGLVRELQQAGHEVVFVPDSGAAELFLTQEVSTTQPSAASQKQYLFVYGADRMRNRNAARMLRDVAAKGPEVGAHIIMSGASLHGVKEDALGGGYEAEPLPLFESRMVIDGTQADVSAVVAYGYKWNSEDRPGRAILSADRGNAEVIRLYE